MLEQRVNGFVGVDTMLIAVDPVDKAVPSQLDLGH